MTYYFNKPVIDSMIGGKILKIDVVLDSKNRIDMIDVVTDRGTVSAWAEADCCGYAWIDEIAGLDTVIGGTITGVNTTDERFDIGDDEYSQRDSFVEVLSTDKGDFAMFTFCEHNGYYSGWINWRNYPNF